ncbi:MAG: argininosuccinate lyase, partial [Candidatus Omnitrophota bacterium]
WDKERIEKAIEDESLYATDLVYYLVRKGVPFREAHNIIGNLMLFCSENRKKIREMSSKELKRFSEKLNQKEVFAILTSKSRLLSKNFSGGEEG